MLDHLVTRVLAHVSTVRMAAHELFADVCGVNMPWSQTKATLGRDEVNVPSCDKLREAGLETYYGNLHMVLSEAWEGKVLRSLRGGRFLGPASLLTVEADGMLAGGIFVSGLRRPDFSRANAAVMIGIHRMPQHKALRRQRGGGGNATGDDHRQPFTGVTPLLVDKAAAWSAAHRLPLLYVCPYGEIRERLGSLGFEPAVDALLPAKPLLFGTLDLHDDVCEESSIMALRVKVPARRDELRR